MKVSTITTIAMAVTGQAYVVRRNATTVTGILQSIFDSMTNADNHLLNVEKDPVALHTAGFALINTLESSAETAQNMAPLTVADVASIANLSQQVTTIGLKFLTDLQDAAPVFAAHGVCTFAHGFCVALASASNKLFTATSAKFPPESQTMAEKEITTKNAAFDKAQAALAPGSCVDQVPPPQIPVGAGPFPFPPGTTPPSFTPGFSPPGGPPGFILPNFTAPGFLPPIPNPPVPGTPADGPAAGSSTTTSAAWHTGTHTPSTPHSGTPGHNDTHTSTPPRPVTGSANVLGRPLGCALTVASMVLVSFIL